MDTSSTPPLAYLQVPMPTSHNDSTLDVPIKSEKVISNLSHSFIYENTFENRLENNGATICLTIHLGILANNLKSV